MSGFRFRLQKVLDLRALRERECGAELANAEQAASHALQVRDAIDAVRAAGLAQIGEAQGNGGSAGELQRLRAVLAQLERHLHEADHAHQEAEVKADEARSGFTVAAQARHAIQNLRERQQRAWQSATATTEQKQMDEIALTRHTNGKNRGAA